MQFRARITDADSSITHYESRIYDAVKDIPEVEFVHIGTSRASESDDGREITVEFTVTPARDGVEAPTIESSLDQAISITGNSTLKAELPSA